MKKRKKTKVIPTINLAGVSMTIAGTRKKIHRSPRIDRHQMAGFFQFHICRRFPYYEKFFSELITAIPSKEIPLYIGLDLPLFVKKVLEARLKTEIPPDDGSHGRESK
jgi:hypothetical protein